MKIPIGGDHAGFQYKEAIKIFLTEAGHEVVDFGPDSEASCDYPDFSHPLAKSINDGVYPLGILICGSANGVAMTANKHQGIRAAICWGEELAQLARGHNDANIICIPARFVREGDAEKMVAHFITTDFEGGRHGRRVEKIACA
jgi:ribose 5-phosphate isomerase B